MKETVYEQLDLPCYSPESISVLNQLFQKPLLKITIKEEQYNFCLIPKLPALSWAIKIYALCGNENVVIYLDSVTAFSEANIGLDEKSLENLNPQLQAALVEIKLAHFFQSLENIFGQSVSLYSVEKCTEKYYPEDEALYFSLTNPQGFQSMAMILADFKGKFYESLCKFYDEKGERLEERTKDFQNFSLPCTFVIGNILLTSSELQSIQTGDILISTNKIHKQGLKTCLYFSQKKKSPYFTGNIQDNIYTLGELIMSEIEQTEEQNLNIEAILAPTQEVALEEIPLDISFVLDTINLTLSEIKNLTSGQVIPTKKTLDEPISLMVNNKKIGSGTLVNVNGFIGVQIHTLS